MRDSHTFDYYLANEFGAVKNYIILDQKNLYHPKIILLAVFKFYAQYHIICLGLRRC